MPEFHKLHSSHRFFYHVSSLPLKNWPTQKFCEDHVGRRPTWTNKAYFPLPLSDEENELIRKIVPGKSLWIAMWRRIDWNYWTGSIEWGNHARVEAWSSEEESLQWHNVYTN